VFSSVLDDAIKANLAREMLRVLKPGGMIPVLPKVSKDQWRRTG
jgi:ubiquinone/menaquinone biosynthesis C-methylase UbiE